MNNYQWLGNVVKDNVKKIKKFMNMVNKYDLIGLLLFKSLIDYDPS